MQEIWFEHWEDLTIAEKIVTHQVHPRPHEKDWDFDTQLFRVITMGLQSFAEGTECYSILVVKGALHLLPNSLEAVFFAFITLEKEVKDLLDCYLKDLPGLHERLSRVFSGIPELIFMHCINVKNEEYLKRFKGKALKDRKFYIRCLYLMIKNGLFGAFKTFLDRQNPAELTAIEQWELFECAVATTYRFEVFKILASKTDVFDLLLPSPDDGNSLLEFTVNYFLFDLGFGAHEGSIPIESNVDVNSELFLSYSQLIDLLKEYGLPEHPRAREEGLVSYLLNPDRIVWEWCKDADPWSGKVWVHWESIDYRISRGLEKTYLEWRKRAPVPGPGQIISDTPIEYHPPLWDYFYHLNLQSPIQINCVNTYRVRPIRRHSEKDT